MYPGQQYNKQKKEEQRNQGYPGSHGYPGAYPPPQSYPSPYPPPSGPYPPPPGPPSSSPYPPPPGPPSSSPYPSPYPPPSGPYPPPSGPYPPPPSSGPYPPPSSSGPYPPPPSGPPPSGPYPPPYPSPSGGHYPPPYPPPHGPPPHSGGHDSKGHPPSSQPASYQPPPGPPHGHGPPPGAPPPYHHGAYQQPHGPQSGHLQHPGGGGYYQLSNCTGRRRALLIGINYFRSQHELKGCLNDVKNVKEFLRKYYNYREDDMVILTDDQRDAKNIPTRRNIIAAFQWLVRDARSNDSFFLHFSGHGGQLKDQDGDEDDGFDETIMPVDWQTAGQIRDDDMNAILVKPLPAGVRLTVIFDSCHSGTALDLPYVYSTKGVIKQPNLLSDGGSALLNAGKSYMRGDLKGISSTLLAFTKKATSGDKIHAKNKETKSSPADVIMLSGCKDLQTSADTFEAGQSTGAMSYAFMSVLSQSRDITYQQLLSSVREILSAKYSQKPQLSASHPIDMNQKFMM